jgi:enoyl-CoA hydratase/carnithine racemase
VSLVEVERDGLSRSSCSTGPEALNALSDELMDELVSTLPSSTATPEIRCIVLGGSERAFAAGADIGELAQASA